MDVIQKDAIWYDFFYTELTTGLRRGEICGLMWSDFDERSGILKINRTLHREKGGRLVAGDTKTYAGTRKIVPPPSTAELLRERKCKSFSPWIFHDPLRPEAPMNPDSAYRQLKKFLTEAGLPDIRFHDLRHTFSTHALASGVDAKTLSGILGHTKASFTLDTYTHMWRPGTTTARASSNIPATVWPPCKSESVPAPSLETERVSYSQNIKQSETMSA